MKKLLSAVTLMFFLFISQYSGFAEGLDIDSKAYILIDAKTGQTLVEQNPNQQLHPASTTKIMTAILALENGKMDQMMTANAIAVSQKYVDKDGINLGIGINGSNIGIADGEQLKLEDLLNALLIKSANDAANVIADNLAPSRAEFVNLMNKRALELGAVNTRFTNACGLDIQDGHPDHVTTASDLAIIARHAMQFSEFRNIVIKLKHVMPDTNKHPASFWPSDYLTTTNKLLLYNKYKSPLYTVTGIKTGYTVNSDFNMVSSGKNENGMELISVILGAKGTDSHYIFSKKLLDYGFENYSIQKVAGAGEEIEKTTVNEAVSNELLSLVTENELSCVMPNDINLWKIEKKHFVEPNITAPINAGDVLGYIEYTNNGTLLGKVNLVAASSVDKITKIQSVKDDAATIIDHPAVKKIIMIPLAAVLALALLRFILRRISKLVKARKQEN